MNDALTPINNNGGSASADFNLKTLMHMSIGAGIGSLLEYYSWGLVAYFSTELKQAYFPRSSSEENTLLIEFSLYGVAFACRPFGAMIFGRISDKYGRIYGLRVSIIAMAIPTIIFGLIPSFSVIGYGATFLAILCRIAQGLAVGGEWATAVIYTIEESPSNVSGLMIGILWAFGMGGYFALLSYDIWDWSHDANTSWTWRIPFVFSIVVAVFGYYIRQFMPESTVTQQTQTQTPVPDVLSSDPLRNALVNYWREILVIMCATLSTSALYYTIMVWIPIYLKSSIGRDDSYADDVLLACMAVTVIGCPFVGYLSDRYGNYKFTKYSMIASIAVVIFAYTAINFTYNLILISFCQILLAFVVCAMVGQLVWTALWVTDASVRVTVNAIGMNLCLALFTSTVFDIETELADASSNYGFVYALLYVLFFMFVTLIAIIYGTEYYEKSDNEHVYQSIKSVNGSSQSEYVENYQEDEMEIHDFDGTVI